MEASTSKPSSSCKHNNSREEIVFFDLETNVPNKPGKRFWVLEFGAIVVCPRKLVELGSYNTLIRPGDLSVVGLKSSRDDGITRAKVSVAPLFEEVADEIFAVLDGRVWAGHNIRRFDCVRINDAFARIGRVPPKPVGLIDSLGVLGHKFGRRAGDMKMATLATYFGLGQQKHRSLDDVRMNLEVLKHCATVLFLEASLPNVLKGNNMPMASPTIITRSKTNYLGKLPTSLGTQVIMNTTNRKSPPISANFSIGYQRSVPYTTRSSLAKMTESVKNVLCKANGNQHLSQILKHSHSLLR